MSGQEKFNINAGNQPNGGIAITVVGERGRKELPPGTKGGENLKPDRHYEYSVRIMQLFRTFSAGHPEIRCSDSGCQCSPL